ncbi:hypothetical protein B566_EDAN016271 [Ephemera danica]|nr:hypothetical protein B566_EDAN016271 [Ephemera danica]
MWFISILIAALCCLIILYLTEKEPAPIIGIYKQKGKWYYLKNVIFRLLYLRKQLELKKAASKEGHSKRPEMMEKMKPLSQHEKAFDAVFFVAANKEGFYLALGNERRKNGITNGLCYIRVPGIGLLLSEKLPSTELKSSSTEEYYAAEGTQIQAIKPMEKWRIRYHGKMYHQSDKTKVFDVKFDADWSSEFPHFDYEKDLHPSAIARAISRETWTREYFKSLEEAHQSHYEQIGHLKGSLIVNGEKRNILSQSFRDHSFGNKRDWELMHRYAFHIIFLRDGSSVVVAVVCQPSTASWMEMGFICSAEGQIEPIEWCDLELYRHGEGGTPPTDYAFQYSAGGRTRLLQVKVVDIAEHRVNEAHMVERFVEVRDDGMMGWGVSEWHYHHKLLTNK